MPETTKLHPKQPVAAALASRAAVRPALRQGGAFALGLAGGWALPLQSNVISRYRAAS